MGLHSTVSEDNVSTLEFFNFFLTFCLACSPPPNILTIRAAKIKQEETFARKMKKLFFLGLVFCMLFVGEAAIMRKRLDVDENIDTAVVEDDVQGEVPAQNATSASMEKHRESYLFNGHGAYCSLIEGGCYEGEGDCDWHDECIRGLVCGNDNCCVNGVCEWGQGDCDKDSDCADGFVCGSNNCRSMDPTIYRDWFDWNDDCCE